MHPPSELGLLREQIDRLDLELVELLARRREIVKQVAAVKRIHRLPGLDPLREAQMKGALAAAATARGVPTPLVETVLDAILQDSRKLVG